MSASKPRVWLSWSTGKDSAWTLHELRRAGEVDVVALLSTINETAERVAMHAVREKLLERQAAAADLPLVKVPIPYPCPNGVYEAAMSRAMERARADGVTAVAFGDLFLEDIRAYRVEKLAGTGIEPLFPLFGRDTRELAREMLRGGLTAILTSVDPKALDPSFAGRDFDAALLDDLPDGVDPCGENGEFHTFVTGGPMFAPDATPIAVRRGEVVVRDGFVFADVLPD